MFVMFDLPVTTKSERRAAAKFRLWLLDQGWEMSQFSVYLRWCASKEQGERWLREISRNLPGTGKVHVLMVTDRQFEQMVVFRGRSRAGKRPKPEQLTLF
jgi:CRISPR-associated protein Cas2